MDSSDFLYVAGHGITGMVLVCIMTGWLRWLIVDADSGRGVDHGFDYGYAIFLIAGALVGLVVGLWLSLAAVIRSH